MPGGDGVLDGTTVMGATCFPPKLRFSYFLKCFQLVSTVVLKVNKDIYFLLIHQII